MTTRAHRIALAAALCSLFLSEPFNRDGLEAQGASDVQSRMRDIYETRTYPVQGTPGTWLQNGSGYSRLEPVVGEPGSDLVTYSAATGERRVLIAAKQLVPNGTSARLIMEGYALSNNGGVALVEANGRLEPAGRRVVDYWLFSPSTGRLELLVQNVDAGFVSNALSPDAQSIRFRRTNDWYMSDIRGANQVRLTSGADRDSVSIGGTSWSPDGRWISYSESNSATVPKRSMLEPIDPTYPRVRESRFSRVGEPIAKWRVGIASPSGGAPRWLDIPAPTEGHYLGRITWSPASTEFIVEILSRFRNARQFLLVNAQSGATRTLYEETDSAWVDASYETNAGVDWIEQGKACVIVSERDGWRRAYVYSREGKLLRLLTPPSQDIIERGPVDTVAGWFYYYASPDNATQRYLYRVRLDGRGDAVRITPANQPGFHLYRVSPDNRWAIHTYSTFDRVPVVDMVSLPSHARVRVLEQNSSTQEKVAQVLPGNHEFLRLNIGNNISLDAWLMKPRDFDSTRRYPLLVYVYGEPHSQTVLDQWSGNQLFHQAIADLGYLVLSMDNRGTPAPKGAAWRRAAFGSLGPLSTEEQAAGVVALSRQRSYVDSSRVAVWGWSGGGSNTLNALFRKPEIFHVGIAIAPKPQPHLYNSWFQEIYMRTPEVNPDGYRKSSPMNFAQGLKGKLLIIHGTGETNTHVQITEGLVDRLIALGKSFDYMSYPNRNHGISEGEGTTLHLRMLFVRFLQANLPAGAR